MFKFIDILKNITFNMVLFHEVMLFIYHMAYLNYIIIYIKIYFIYIIIYINI
jgi:hypothetical protein